MPRPVGSKNKVQACARENVLAVFNRLGGTSGMADWARKNPNEFYRIYAKLVPAPPQELTLSPDSKLAIQVSFV